VASAEHAAADPAAAVSPASTGEGTLAAELALLQRARVALRDGRPDEALALLDQHARQYPEGQLVDERRVLAAEAGRSPTARTTP
jgi:hypothetical protein